MCGTQAVDLCIAMHVIEQSSLLWVHLCGVGSGACVDGPLGLLWRMGSCVLDLMGSVRNPWDLMGSVRNPWDLLGSVRNSWDLLKSPVRNRWYLLGSVRNAWDLMGGV